MRRKMLLNGFFKTRIRFIDSYGGIPLREITEICGPAGTGKTKMLHQLSVSYLIDSGNRLVYYYDIDNTFDPNYIVKICSRWNYNSDNVLDRLLIQRLTDIYTLKKSLNHAIRKGGNSDCLLIIDSIPNLFVRELVYENEDDWTSEQIKLIIQLGESLRKASKHCTILISNHVRSGIISDRKGKKEKDSAYETYFNIIPALGAVWEDFVDNRFFIIKTKRNLRLMLVYFSSYMPETFGLIKFQNEIFM